MMTKKHEEKSIIHRSDEQPHFLSEVMRTHHALLNTSTRIVGMPPAKLGLLRLLAISYPDKIGIMELAKLLNVNAAAVTRQVKEAEAERLVKRIPDSKDGRRNYVKLSSEGVRVFTQLHKRAHEFEEQLYKEIGPGDIEIAIRVLAKVRSAVENYPDSRIFEGIRKTE